MYDDEGMTELADLVVDVLAPLNARRATPCGASFIGVSPSSRVGLDSLQRALAARVGEVHVTTVPPRFCPNGDAGEEYSMLTVRP